MKQFMILTLIGTAFAGGALGQGFPGTYTGAIGGVPMTLVIQQEGETLQGEADASGYRYTLAGQVTGSTARGTLADPQAGGAVEVEMLVQGDHLTLTLLAADPYSGQVQHTPVLFQRSGASQAAPAASPDATSKSSTGRPPGASTQHIERDTRLVGNWSYTETMMSGEFSAVTQPLVPTGPYRR